MADQSKKSQKPIQPVTQQEDFNTKPVDLYDAPIFTDKENTEENMHDAAQANIDRFGFNPDKFANRPRPNGRET